MIYVFLGANILAFIVFIYVAGRMMRKKPKSALVQKNKKGEK